MKIIILTFCLFLTVQQTSCGQKVNSAAGDKFALGNEVLLAKKDILQNKRVAVLTNQTGLLQNGGHIIDELVTGGINVVKIFSPEHGIRGDENYSDTDEKTGIKIVSLYGAKNKPTAGDLTDVDLVIYDIQDVGARFYTYTSTLYNLIEAALENGKKIIVCDRPVIINPDYVDGFMLESKFSSFVGQIPTPVCYGMTCGELASFLNANVFASAADLEVLAMQNYSRRTNYTDLKLPWVKPSPSMFYPSTALCYPATCFLEGTNVSEGRGTDKPFEYFGAPWMNAEVIADELNSYGLKGVTFEIHPFTPSEKISEYPPKFFNIGCNGLYINVTDKNQFEPVKCGIAILAALAKHHSEFILNKNNFIDKLAGTDILRNAIKQKLSYSDIVALWSNGVDSFRSEREKYLLYK